MRHLRERGTGELVGQCLQENLAMVALARAAGFSVGGGGDVVPMRLALR